MCVLACGCALGCGNLPSAILVKESGSLPQWLLLPIAPQIGAGGGLEHPSPFHADISIGLFLCWSCTGKHSCFELMYVCDHNVMSGRQYSTAPPPHTPCWLLNFSACFPQCPSERFSIDFELLFPHPLQIFFWPRLFMKMEPACFPHWIDVLGI